MGSAIKGARSRVEKIVWINTFVNVCGILTPPPGAIDPRHTIYPRLAPWGYHISPATRAVPIQAAILGTLKTYNQGLPNRRDPILYVFRLARRSLLQLELESKYRAARRANTAIAQLSRGLFEGEKHQVLLGVTGSGKTFTMAKVIDEVGRPALMLAHNKTLAAQLYHEFEPSFRPMRSSTSSVTTITISRKLTFRRAMCISRRKRPSTTSSTSCGSRHESLFERRDCVIVARVSCVYGLGSPEAYYGMLLFLERGQKIRRQDITAAGRILYERTDTDFRRGTFRVRGDMIEIYPTYDDNAYRIELWETRSNRIRKSIRSSARSRSTLGCPSIPRPTT